MNILFIGDIVGKPARKALSKFLFRIQQEQEINFIIANAENIAGGIGVTKETAQELFSLGVNVLTSGNHIWAKKEVIQYLNEEKRLLRPLNYPKPCAGSGYIIEQTNSNNKIAVVNLMGRLYLQSLDCPFRAIEDVLQLIKKETNIIIVDFHAEATSEKIAMGWFLDGKVSAVIGTHTHVQTADECLLPNQTAYITDVGMVGPYNSVIGMDKEAAISRFLTQLPIKLEVAKGNCIFGGVVISVDEISGKSLSIKRLLLREKND